MALSLMLELDATSRPFRGCTRAQGTHTGRMRSWHTTRLRVHGQCERTHFRMSTAPPSYFRHIRALQLQIRHPGAVRPRASGERQGNVIVRYKTGVVEARTLGTLELAGSVVWIGEPLLESNHAALPSSIRPEQCLGIAVRRLPRRRASRAQIMQISWGSTCVIMSRHTASTQEQDKGREACSHCLGH